MPDNIVWEFATANFRVVLRTEPEDSDPADSFQFEEDIAVVRSGAVEWFRAGVIVFGPDDEELAADWLYRCAYTSTREFYTSHWDSPYKSRNTLELKARKTVICHYFPGMATGAIAEARIAAAKRGKAYASLRI